MKKLLLIATFFVAQAAIAGNPDKYLPDHTDNQAGIKLRTFVREVISLDNKTLCQIAREDEYHNKKLLALSDNILTNCTLYTKYTIVKSLFNFIKNEGIMACEPVHVAQAILDSFPKTTGVSTGTIFVYMKTFIEKEYPNTQNLILVHWASFACLSARNTDLLANRRIGFAKLYAKLSPTKSKDYEEFSDKLLAEIQK